MLIADFGDIVEIFSQTLGRIIFLVKHLKSREEKFLVVFYLISL